MKFKKIEINMAYDDIVSAKRPTEGSWISAHCVIALAAKKYVRDDIEVLVSGTSINFLKACKTKSLESEKWKPIHDKRLIYSCLLPPEMQEYTVAFDSGEKVKPGSFSIHVPENILVDFHNFTDEDFSIKGTENAQTERLAQG